MGKGAADVHASATANSKDSKAPFTRNTCPSGADGQHRHWVALAGFWWRLFVIPGLILLVAVIINESGWFLVETLRNTWGGRGGMAPDFNENQGSSRALEVLRSRVGDGDRAVRAAAVNALKELALGGAVSLGASEVFLGILSDSRVAPDVQELVLEHLSRMARPTPILERLCTTLVHGPVGQQCSEASVLKTQSVWAFWCSFAEASVPLQDLLASKLLTGTIEEQLLILSSVRARRHVAKSFQDAVVHLSQDGHSVEQVQLGAVRVMSYIAWRLQEEPCSDVIDAVKSVLASGAHSVSHKLRAVVLNVLLEALRSGGNSIAVNHAVALVESTVNETERALVTDEILGSLSARSPDVALTVATAELREHRNATRHALALSAVLNVASHEAGTRALDVLKHQLELVGGANASESTAILRGIMQLASRGKAEAMEVVEEQLRGCLNTFPSSKVGQQGDGRESPGNLVDVQGGECTSSFVNELWETIHRAARSGNANALEVVMWQLQVNGSNHTLVHDLFQTVGVAALRSDRALDMVFEFSGHADARLRAAATSALGLVVKRDFRWD